MLSALSVERRYGTVSMICQIDDGIRIVWGSLLYTHGTTAYVPLGIPTDAVQRRSCVPQIAAHLMQAV